MADEGSTGGDEWPLLRAMAEDGRVEAMLETIRAVPAEHRRMALYGSTIRHLAFDSWENSNLDVMIALADAAIAECDAKSGDRLQLENVICYNMSANLADCWNDEFGRERRHFEKGLSYAFRALELKSRLKRGPAAEGMAVWAIGKHQQSLGRLEEARASFRRCLALATEVAAGDGTPAAIVPEASEGYIIAAGYVALVEGDLATLAAIRTLLEEQMARGGEAKVDAGIILAQLRKTGSQLSIEF